ncbi:MAG TPA: amino acid adenylation domain-containing protein, partial [Thermoanaerobaculia bacterium]|nr:amino acid adenylation domain-containing protein [Thermoanaerobaculia bacterium]
MRTVFPAPEGEPVQRVLAEIPSIVSTLSSPLEAEAWRPFDLERGPLLRVVIEGPVVLFVVHHLVADFWSLALAARELSALYLEESGGVAAALPALQLSYLDFTHWQEEALAGARGEALLEWWRERLAGLPDLDLPTDRPRPPIQTWRGAGQAAVLPPALADGVRVLASRHGATLFTALLAAFQAQLGRYTGQEDLAVGAPTAGRSAPELAGLVGYFVNPVVLRADLAGEPPFTDVLARARETVLTALARADLPFALLAERLRPVRDPARPPLFQAMLVLQAGRPQDDPGLAAFALGEAGARIGLGGLVLESLPLAERRAQFELILRLAEETSGGGLLVSLEHNADLFDTATAARMVEHFRTLLAGAVAGPDRCWADLPLLTEDERRQILGEWSGAGPRPEDTDATLSGLFEAWVARTPQAPALVFEGESVSYGDLDARAERLAGRLRRLGVGPEVVVGLCAERSIEMVVGILGVLKAGGAWLPLDPALPRERLAQLLADAEVPVLLAKAAVLPGLPPMEGESTRLLLLDSADEPEEIPASRTSSATADNLAYVLYTSGSTGAPKAVAVPHRGVANRLLRAREAYGIRPGDAMLQRAAGGFDVSVWEIFGPLSSGARVVLARPGGQRDPRYLARLLDEQEVTLVNFTPSALDALLDEEGIAERAASLRQVFVGAEALPRDLPVRFFAAGLRAPLDNMYGPTEASIDLLWYSCRPDARLPEGSTVPIGRPIPGTRVHVLDARLAPVPAGIPGELWLGGVGLARGYRGRPDLTAERFLPDPLPTKPGERLYRTGDLARWLPGGDLEFLGRVDLQVKVRGVRVEPGEVEAVLRGRPGVREAAVAPRADATGRQGLVAYVVWDAPSVLDARELRSFLAARLPEAMVPAAFLPVPELPRTPSGKLDRRALASAISGLFTTPPAGDGGLHTPPRTPVEELLAGLWSELLGAERIGVRDDFFELGGHSLLATRMLARVSRLFGVELPVSAAFQFPTLAALAEQIEAALGAASAPPLRAVARDRFPGGAPLSFAQRRLWFLDRLQPGSPVYNLPGAVRLTGPLDLAALASALSGVARRHESLRTVFRLEGDEPVQVIGSPSTVASAPPPLVDLAGLTEGLRNAEAEWLAGREAIRPFELAAGPLCRVSLLRLASGDHLLLVNLHHSVADGWSLGIFLRELAALYEGVPLPELPVQYADYAVWQREWMQGEALDSQLAYWRRQLADLPVVELPADRPRPAIRRLRGGVRSALLPAGLADAVEGIARGRGATLFMELLAAFQILLRRYTGEVSVPVGSPVANRQRPEVEGLIGFFANTLVLRASMADDPPFDTLLARVREACLEAYAHQDLPFERLVEELRPGRDLSQTPLFQVMLVLEEPLPRPRAGALELRPERIETETAKFDLTLTAAPVEDGRLVSALEYDSALFDPVTVDRMLGHWRTLLAGIVADPAAPVSALPLLQEAETDQVLRQWNATGAEERPDLCLHELFAEQARRTPTAEALVASDEEGDLRLTYQELSARAGRLAQRLRRLGVEPEVRVGVCLERSADLVVSLLAVLEAGGAYVPLDPAYPRERLE